MEKTFTQDTPSKLKILRSGDPKTMFGRMSPAEILDRYGPPRTLLSSSHKTEKCLAVDVFGPRPPLHTRRLLHPRNAGLFGRLSWPFQRTHANAHAFAGP